MAAPSVSQGLLSALTLSHLTELHSLALKALASQDAITESFERLHAQASRTASILANLWPRLELLASTAESSAASGSGDGAAFESLGLLAALDIAPAPSSSVSCSSIVGGDGDDSVAYEPAAGSTAGNGIASEMLALAATQVFSALTNLSTLCSSMSSRAADSTAAAAALAAEITSASVPAPLLARLLPPPTGARVPPLGLSVADALSLAQTQAHVISSEAARLSGLLSAATTAVTVFLPSPDAAPGVESAVVTEGHWARASRLDFSAGTGPSGRAAAGGGVSRPTGSAQTLVFDPSGRAGELKLATVGGQAAGTDASAGVGDIEPLVALQDLPKLWSADQTAMKVLAEGRKTVQAATQRPPKQ